MPDYVSTDPNYGAVTPDYVSTDPNYGLPHVNVRTAVYGPVVGEHYRDAMFGPEGNPLGPDDLALSPDDQQTFPRGSKVQVNGQGKVYTVADSSYRRPGQPNSHMVEFRDQPSPPPQVTLTPAPQPQSQTSYVSTDPNYGLVNPAIKQAGADAMAAPAEAPWYQRWYDAARKALPEPEIVKQAEKIADQAVSEPLGKMPDLVSADTIHKGLSAMGQIGATSDADLKESPDQKAINDVIAKNAAGMTNPNFLATLPLYELKAVRAAQALKAAQGAYESGQQAVEAGQAGNRPGMVGGITQTALSTAIAAALGKSTLHEATPAAEASSEPRTTETNATPASPASASEAEKAPDTAPAPEAPGSIQDFGPSYARHEAPQTTDDITRFVLNRNAALNEEAAPLRQSVAIAEQMGMRPHPSVEARLAEIESELRNPVIPKASTPEPQPVDEGGNPVKLSPDEEAAAAGTAPTAVAPATDSAYGRAVATERPEPALVGETPGVAETAEPAASGEVGASQDFAQHGVSRAARAAADEVNVTPAEIYSAEDHITNGRKLVSEGADTESVVADALKRGSFSRDAIDLAVNRDAELTKAARVARRAADDARDMRQTPNDGVLEKAAREAELKQQQWEDRVIRPIRGQFADTGHALQTAIDLNTGDAIDYVKTFRQQAGREPSPVERTKIDRQAANVRRVRDAQDADVTRRAERASKGATKKLDRKQLRSFLDKLHEELFKDCAT